MKDDEDSKDMKSVSKKLDTPRKEHKSPVQGLTEFQLFSGNMQRDFTVLKLKRLIEQSREVKRLKLIALLSDYISGDCSVAWQEGEPRFVRIKK